ncbi:TolC family protein [Kaistella jeonii]|uniref:Transporter n=1 Tax=Kaistella jeonii TaxID=266749 RepID=A0A0C1FLC1_9FLAO|nr:TolC family protein [Kaistella jeonii]KIA88739.1 transporter [Kaistella jeonii]SFC10211.1 Outer membrane protein TolC [Kaistella jeonii]VEI95266.1 Outer membrane efflux protein [Kaistella jeonii]
MKQLIKIIIAFSVLIAIQLKAQTPISLESAYEKAFKNNLNLKNGQLRIDYQDKIKKSYAVVDPLNVSGEIGQFVSAYTDNKFSVNQTLRLPGFYNNQKQVLIEEWKNSMLTLDVQKWQLKREIALTYNDLNYQNEKEKLLLRADSIYTNYYNRAELRLKKGESNILEKTTAENYRSQAEIQLANLKKDREVSLYQFNYLINDETLYSNENSNFYEMNGLTQDLNYAGNPVVLKQLEQQKNIELAKLNAEKSKLLPTFNIAYNNSSMYGTGADDKFYERSARFHSGMIGVGIPLFNGAQKSLIEGQKINQLIAENNYKLGSKNLKNQYSSLFGEFEKLKSETDYYKSKGLKNAETIMKTANRLYYEGEINYLEWSILINQSLDIQNKLIDTQKMLNEKTIQLNNLTQQ